MSELDIIASLLSLGVGGVLGIIIFFMYRRDRRDTEKRWAELAEELIECRGDENKTRRKHTKALTELTVLLRKMNGNSRK